MAPIIQHGYLYVEIHDDVATEDEIDNAVYEKKCVKGAFQEGDLKWCDCGHINEAEDHHNVPSAHEH